MRIRTLAIAALLIVALTAGPAAAATSRSKDRAAQTWVGQVLRHSPERLTPPGSGGHPPAPGRHFDYQGSYCPTSAEACIKILARFRIVPLNPQAAVALRRVSGGSAKLVGWRAPASDGEHNGILYVRRVKRH
ncbi:MAG: hypothetical protein AB1679_35240 [Actinomycetota bacterium]|jgi:hypothetical protein